MSEFLTLYVAVLQAVTDPPLIVSEPFAVSLCSTPSKMPPLAPRVIVAPLLRFSVGLLFGEPTFTRKSEPVSLPSIVTFSSVTVSEVTLSTVEVVPRLIENGVLLFCAMASVSDVIVIAFELPMVSVLLCVTSLKSLMVPPLVAALYAWASVA